MAESAPLTLIWPDWPSPRRVKACSTTRKGGRSTSPWDSLNLGGHVGDDPEAVISNRALLAAELDLRPERIGWLEQVHGSAVEELPGAGRGVCADASTAVASGPVCAILTADCLPVLFCDRSGTRVAAAHAGWRGLLAGVLENTIARFDAPGAVMAWLGPAIGPEAFEVGPEVRAAFVTADPEAAGCFRARDRRRGRYLADIYALASLRLRAAGVENIFGGGYCTWSDPLFYSFRRDGCTGRQASLIWLAPS